ncbi:MAG: DUF4349 domain-containing protein [Pseudomonadota bacterium]
MKAWKGCAFLALVLLAGCSQPGEDLAGAPIGGERAKAGAFLAYEHQVGISLDPAQIEQRLAAVREACQDERFGACDLLGIEQNAGGYRSASLSLRIVPDGVDKLLALAVEGGSLESRRTQAEDLAQAVSDTQQQRQRLERQHQTLLAFQERKDLSVSDMLALARELAEVEVQLAASQQDAAQQQRRLDTNLLILDFSSAPPGRLSRLGQAFDNLADNIAEGAGQALEMLGYGLPFLVILFPLALLLHWLWRRITRTAIRHKP